METKIEHFRRMQPIAELERKWNKAKGRHSNAFWTAEQIDLACARGRTLSKRLRVI